LNTTEEEKKLENEEYLIRIDPNYMNEYIWTEKDILGKGGFGTVYKALKVSS
jgi:hypothetical protein